MPQVAPEMSRTDQVSPTHRQLPKTVTGPSGSRERPRDLHLDGPPPSAPSAPSRVSPRRSQSPESEIQGREGAKLREGPSSRKTVLSIAGLFVVGLVSIISGVLVLFTQHQYTAFVIVGVLFILLGSGMWIVCLVLQKKNVRKYVVGLEQDLYFLNIGLSSNPVWKLMFEEEDSTSENNQQLDRRHGFA